MKLHHRGVLSQQNCTIASWNLPQKAFVQLARSRLRRSVLRWICMALARSLKVSLWAWRNSCTTLVHRSSSATSKGSASPPGIQRKPSREAKK